MCGSSTCYHYVWADMHHMPWCHGMMHASSYLQVQLYTCSCMSSHGCCKLLTGIQWPGRQLFPIKIEVSCCIWTSCTAKICRALWRQVCGAPALLLAPKWWSQPNRAANWREALRVYGQLQYVATILCLELQRSRANFSLTGQNMVWIQCQCSQLWCH